MVAPIQIYCVKLSKLVFTLHLSLFLNACLRNLSHCQVYQFEEFAAATE